MGKRRKGKVEAFDDAVNVHELSGKQFAKLAGVMAGIDQSDPQAQVKSMAEIILRCAHDSDGNKCYTEIDEILDEPVTFLMELGECCLRVNGLDDAADQVGNLSAVQN